ncbi:MAG TPA: hypothetical protein VGS27_14105 [Candidatus Sulfotelmatobacter sp.]|nr:hypothetical protein [Candidatus Sulfotelmatobacter sp.]
MEIGARWISLRLAKILARRTVVILTTATLAIAAAAMGVWTHKASAAQMKAEVAAAKQAATLNDVMAKLNQMESQMRQQARVLNAKLEALEYQNERMASYEVRDHAATARLELAAERTPMYTGGATPNSPQFSSPSLTSPIELSSSLCYKGETGLFGSESNAVAAQASGKGNVGLDEFGDGVDATAKARGTLQLKEEERGKSSMELDVCLQMPQFNIFGTNPPTVNVSQFLSDITTGSETVADKLAQMYMNIPALQNGTIATGLDDLSNLNLQPSFQQVLQGIENPTAVFQNTSGLISTIPLPGNLSALLSDPSSLLPQASDLDPANFCSNFSSGGTGLISNICSKVPSSLASLSGVSQAIGDLSNVQGALTTFKTSVQTGVSSMCNSVNGALGALNQTSITVPQLATFSLPTDVGFTSYITGTKIPDGVGFTNSRTVSAGPQTISSPFNLPAVTCPAF